MEIPKIDALQGALAASGVISSPTATSNSNTSGGFLEVLKRSLDQVSQSQNHAESLATQYQLGKNGVSLEDAMLAMQKSNVSFQAAIQVRNKLLSAYHDIMNMQV